MSAKVTIRQAKGRLPKQGRSRTGFWIGMFLLVSLGALAGLIALFAAMQPEQQSQISPENQAIQQPFKDQPGNHFMDPNEVRSIKIADAGQVDPGGSAIAVVKLVAGDIPAGVEHGKVLTDTNCAPDAQGISHCHNELDLGDGMKATVQHDHVLSKVPCFTPGQTLKIVA